MRRFWQKRLGNILFTVTDSGIGISREESQMLFRPFSQANSSITRNYGGTGLGLAICKKLVEMMGGEIWFFSKEGVGTTFSFTLNCEVLTKTAPMKLISEYQSTGESPEVPADKTYEVLLVDDSEDNRILIEAFLENTNFNITEAENGVIAVAKTKNKKFDIILMDMQMPILDGYSATQQIREWEKVNSLGRTPIIALTAYALVDEKRKSFAVGCDEHLTKPITKSHLIGLLTKLVREKDTEH
jgi:CheY-like chemotaxis protein